MELKQRLEVDAVFEEAEEEEGPLRRCVCVVGGVCVVCVCVEGVYMCL